MTENNETVCLRLEGYQTFCFLELPQKIDGSMKEYSVSDIENIVNFFKEKLGTQDLPSGYKKKPDYYQKLYFYQPKPSFPHILLRFPNQNKSIDKLERLVKEERYNIPDIGNNLQFYVHVGTNIPIELKFAAEYQILFSGWVSIENYITVSDLQKISSCDYEIIARCNTCSIKAVTSEKITRPNIMSFDIEVYSYNHRRFPSTRDPRDETISICSLTLKYGDSFKDCIADIITRKKCKPFENYLCVPEMQGEIPDMELFQRYVNKYSDIYTSKGLDHPFFSITDTFALVKGLQNPKVSKLLQSSLNAAANASGAGASTTVEEAYKKFIQICKQVYDDWKAYVAGTAASTTTASTTAALTTAASTTTAAALSYQGNDVFDEMQDKFISLNDDADIITKQSDEYSCLKDAILHQKIELARTYANLVAYRKNYPNYLIDKKNIHIHQQESELQVLLEFGRIVKKRNPIIITGYNICGFDFKLIYERLLHIYNSKIGPCGLLKNADTEFETIEWGSNAFKNQAFKFYDFEGRLDLDMIKIIQRDFKLREYTLKAVSEEFVKDYKVEMPYEKMFELWERGSEDDVHTIIDYNIYDCVLPLKLFEKLNVWVGSCEFSNIFNIPITDIFERGQTIRNLSKTVNECLKRKIVLDQLLRCQVCKKWHYHGYYAPYNPVIHASNNKKSKPQNGCCSEECYHRWDGEWFDDLDEEEMAEMGYQFETDEEEKEFWDNM